ncbi:hypothetical protein CP09DC77_0273B, partial [Chlamydia psittaci 09DC77]
GGGGTYSML